MPSQRQGGLAHCKIQQASKELTDHTAVTPPALRAVPTTVPASEQSDPIVLAWKRLTGWSAWSPGLHTGNSAASPGLPAGQLLRPAPSSLLKPRKPNLTFSLLSEEA